MSLRESLVQVFVACAKKRPDKKIKAAPYPPQQIVDKIRSLGFDIEIEVVRRKAMVQEPIVWNMVQLERKAMRDKAREVLDAIGADTDDQEAIECLVRAMRWAQLVGGK